MAEHEKPQILEPGDPPTLLAILIAARRTGDRMLENVARRELEQLGIAVRFLREQRGAAHA
jgi:hypothetical protein